MIRLRTINSNDVDDFFHQSFDTWFGRSEPAAEKMAQAREEFLTAWEKQLRDPSVKARCIEDLDGCALGYIASFDRAGNREVSYWLGKEHWGGGFATEALGLFLKLELTRPLYGRVDTKNQASMRVLEKHGFSWLAEENYHSLSRGIEAVEGLYCLTT